MFGLRRSPLRVFKSAPLDATRDTAPSKVLSRSTIASAVVLAAGAGAAFWWWTQWAQGRAESDAGLAETEISNADLPKAAE
jgi:hypothetical protein